MHSLEESTAVVILTKYYEIRGNIGLLAGVRLTDYMNETKRFMAVLDAEVVALDTGKTVLAGGFLNIQCEKIEVIMPADQEASR